MKRVHNFDLVTSCWIIRVFVEHKKLFSVCDPM